MGLHDYAGEVSANPFASDFLFELQPRGDIKYSFKFNADSFGGTK